MTRPAKRISGLVAGILGLSLLVWGIAESRRPAKWNVLLVTLDTTRADRIGCYRYDRAATPALDALAARGVLFERAYATAPLTLPSHATILTGLNPPEHGIHTNGRNSLGTEIPTLATILSEQGYATGAFVGAFVLHSQFGLARGFDTYDERFSRDHAEQEDELHQNRPGNEVVDAALAWLNGRESRPFFCWVHLYDPHFQYDPHADQFGDRYQNDPYDGEIAFVDLQLQRLWDFLRRRKLEEKTLVVVVGDHGEGLGDHGERTHCYMLYNSTLHVPLIIAPPALPAARRVPEPVSLVDLLPTILEATGHRTPATASGRSLKPAFAGEPLLPGVCYAETDEPYLAARCQTLQCLITDRWKYIRTPRHELYDLSDDPAEMNNLAAAQPDQLGIMERQLAEMEERMERREAPAAQLSSREERAMAGLGYVGGQAVVNADSDEPLPDTKDMLPYFNLCDDALKEMTFKNYAAAEKILRPVVEAAPNYFEARCSLGVCLYHQRRFREAGDVFQAALERGAPPITVNIQLGLSRLEDGKPEDAIGHFQDSLKLRPGAAEVHYYLGVACQRLKRWPESIAEFEAAIDLKPDYAQARLALELSFRMLESDQGQSERRN